MSSERKAIRRNRKHFWTLRKCEHCEAYAVTACGAFIESIEGGKVECRTPICQHCVVERAEGLDLCKHCARAAGAARTSSEIQSTPIEQSLFDNIGRITND